MRGDGLLRSHIYIGRSVWDRLRTVKDPVTGTRHRRAKDPSEVVIREVPELRIIDQELWDRVQARSSRDLARRNVPPDTGTASRGPHFWERRRPKHLLNGKVACGTCGVLFASLGQDYLGRRGAKQGACGNSRRIRRGVLQAHVLEVLSRRMMDPALVAEFVIAFSAGWNRGTGGGKRVDRSGHRVGAGGSREPSISSYLALVS